MSERTVRNYYDKSRIKSAFLKGKNWNIPENAMKPNRIDNKKLSDNELLNTLKEEKDMSIYHKTQIALTYNSNHIEVSTLTEAQTRLIFETNTNGETKKVRVDDIV